MREIYLVLFCWCLSLVGVASTAAIDSVIFWICFILFAASSIRLAEKQDTYLREIDNYYKNKEND